MISIQEFLVLCCEAIFVSYPGSMSDGDYDDVTCGSDPLAFSEHLELQLLSDQLQLAMTDNEENPVINEIYEASPVAWKPVIPSTIQNSQPVSHKPNMRLTLELHERFVASVNQLDSPENMFIFCGSRIILVFLQAIVLSWRGNMLLHPQDFISSKDSAVKKVPWISSSASNQKQLSENAGTKFVIAYDVGETTYYCFVDDRLLATLTALFLAELSKKDNAFLLGTPSDELKKLKISCDELSVTDLSEPLIWYITGSGSDTGSSPSKRDVNSLNSQSHPNKQLISAEVDASVCSGSSMSVDVVSSSHMVGCDLIPVFLSCHSKKSFFQVAVMVRAEFLSANSFAEFSPRVIQLIKSLGFPVEDDCLVGYEVKLPSLVSDYFVLPDCHKSAVVKLNRVVVHQD